MNFIVIIPARFNSSRFPGKPLADINGKPMILHVMEKAVKSGAKRVIVATDHIEILKVIEKAGGEVCLTKIKHRSGIERLKEVITNYRFHPKQVIVNLQGDEPLIPSSIICKIAENIVTNNSDVSTLAVPIISTQDILNTNIVKVVVDINGYALYFSRAPIPWEHKKITNQYHMTNNLFLRHIGIYAYRADFINRYVNWPISKLEKIEDLEQLRVLWYGKKIHVTISYEITSIISVDTPEQLDQVKMLQC